MATSQDFVNWVCSKELEPDFLKYLFIAEGDGLLRFASGAVHQTIYFPEVKAFQVCHPAPDEQRRIIAILDRACEDIATTKVNTETSLQNARAIFVSHLESVFRTRGKGWTKTTLDGLCELISGQHIDAADYNYEGRGIGYLTGPSDFGLRHPEVTKWTEHPKRMARRGDILITVKGSGVGKVNLLDVEEVAISRQLMAVRAKAADVRYLFAFLSTNLDHFQSLANGAAIPGISRGDVLGLMCPMPPAREQPAIVNRIDALSKETERLASLYRQKLARLDALKLSLLHAAFSGKL